jgi:VWFA-related protein
VRAAPRDVVTNKLENRRLFMIVIDDAVMPSRPPDPRAVARAKSIAHDVVARLGANDQAAVVFTMNSKKSQGFTADHSRLEAAIASTTFGGKVGGVGDERYDIGSAWTLANAVTALQSAPQARKTLVFVSAGPDYHPTDRGPAMATGAGGSGTAASETSQRITAELNNLFASATRTHTSVYAFDVNDDLDLMTPGRDFLRTVADLTGGRASIANEDAVQGVTQMLRESSEYYLIGFSPASERPGRHPVEVRTTRPGARVLSRKSFEIAAAEKANAPKPAPLNAAMAGLLPVDSLPMRVVATALPGPTTKEAIVAIALGINQPADDLNGAPEKMTAQIEAYQAGGKFVRATKLDAQLTLKPSASGRAQYDLLGKLSLPPGRYQLRIAAHSPRLNVRGSVFADVDVPDFSRDGVTVAPLVLSTSPAPPAAPANAFAGLLPVVPVSHRTFAGSDRVSILARIVEGGGANKPLVPVTVEATVVDTKNRRVFGRSETITPAAAAVQRAVDYMFDLPITTLPAGDYLLTVKASTPAGTNEKTLRFSRR